MIRVADSEPIIVEDRPQLLGEHIQTIRSPNESGLLVGERLTHRGWPPGAYLAFLNAPIVKLPAGELRKRLYP